ncbi:TIGR01777 family oxidoreductase [Alkalihalobacillus hemicellulosilyticus]|uniref:Cell division inhibitor n=1 Tax=Halalkalibacter hemicellulosilyticusJCM 9152 TaxID=1236971 RepID=W4QIF9_9BACI|nr:TIGR01777 family oxidoreductase [Halalkalibacter hemicellulosilyticus]GAE31129.1 cell division inhibitor [Halalkalibacter hemicellulosilyticusJCM 9152]
MNIAIAGGSGLIGSALTEHLTKQGHTVYILTRDATNKPVKEKVHYVEWLHDKATPEKELQGVKAIINLAGESIGSGRWTEERKQAILNSRIESTRAVIDLIKQLTPTLRVLVNASAIGYYGHSTSKTFSEDSEPVDDSFLTKVVNSWETEAAKARDFGVRVAFCRLGIVLDKKEGALPKMLLPYKLFAGGNLGTGEQWMSWVHMDDVVRLFSLAIENSAIIGPLNVTAPNPVQMKEFGQTLASILNRPHWFPTPTFLLKVVLGEMSTLVLDGQKVLPKKSADFDYTFQYATLEPALTDTLKGKN